MDDFILVPAELGLERPDALVVDDDNLLPVVGEELLALGLRVPDELYLLAHANFPEPTACAVPAERLGYFVPDVLATALACIDRLRRGEAAPAVTTIGVCSEAEAAVRSSSSPVSAFSSLV